MQPKPVPPIRLLAKLLCPYSPLKSLDLLLPVLPLLQLAPLNFKNAILADFLFPTTSVTSYPQV